MALVWRAYRGQCNLLRYLALQPGYSSLRVNRCADEDPDSYSNPNGWRCSVRLHPQRAPINVKQRLLLLHVRRFLTPDANKLT